MFFIENASENQRLGLEVESRQSEIKTSPEEMQPTKSGETFGIDHGSYDPRIQLLRTYAILDKPKEQGLERVSSAKMINMFLFRFLIKPKIVRQIII